MRKKIFNLHSEKNQPPRFCDAVYEDGSVYLEIKNVKQAKIPLKDFTYHDDINVTDNNIDQVNGFLADIKKKKTLENNN